MKSPFKALKSLTFDDVAYCIFGLTVSVIVLGVFLGVRSPEMKEAKAWDFQTDVINIGGKAFIPVTHGTETIIFGSSTTTTLTEAELDLGTSSASRPPTFRAYWTVETSDLRYITDPNGSITATVGPLVKADEVIVIVGLENLVNFRGIGVSDDSTAHITYQKLKPLQH